MKKNERTKRSILKKTKTKIYERSERDRRKLSDTVIP